MKTIPMEKLEREVAETLKAQQGNEPILLTENAAAFGLLVRLPDHLQISEAGVSVCVHGLDGEILLWSETKQDPSEASKKTEPHFGSCLGILEIKTEGDEHLNDCEDYM